MIQWGPNLQTEGSREIQNIFLKAWVFMRAKLRVSKEHIGCVGRALECLQSKLKTGSKPKRNCGAITEGLRTAVTLWDFQENDTSTEQGGHFPEEGVS